MEGRAARERTKTDIPGKNENSTPGGDIGCVVVTVLTRVQNVARGTQDYIMLIPLQLKRF